MPYSLSVLFSFRLFRNFIFGCENLITQTLQSLKLFSILNIEDWAAVYCIVWRSFLEACVVGCAGQEAD